MKKWNDTSVTLVVYPLGCCKFDEEQLVASSVTKAIQKCILRLANRPTKGDCACVCVLGLGPILMRLVDNLIQSVASYKSANTEYTAGVVQFETH